MRNTLLSLFSTLCFIGISLQVLGQKENVSKGFVTKKGIEELKEVPVKLIPYPDSVLWERGERIVVDGLELQGEGNISESLWNECYDIIGEKDFLPTKKNLLIITLEKIPKLEREAYNLMASQEGVTIQSNTEEGFYYGLKTLRQLIIQENGIHYVPRVKIYDKPRFPIRGFMIDAGRNYQDLELIKEHLEIMSDYKLNVFHWHLTDRPAWRIESKAYPQLTAAENHREGRNAGSYYSYTLVSGKK